MSTFSLNTTNILSDSRDEMDWDITSTDTHIDLKTIIPAGTNGKSFGYKQFTIDGELGDSFAIGMRVSPDYASYASKPRDTQWCNGSVAFNIHNDTLDMAALRSGASLWRFEHFDGTYFSPFSDVGDLQLKAPEVRGRVGEVATSTSTNRVTVRIDAHNSKAGDIVRFGSHVSDVQVDFTIGGITLPYYEGFEVASVIDENTFEIVVADVATSDVSYSNAGVTDALALWFTWDQDIVVRFDKQDGDIWKIRMYDKRQSILLVSTTMPEGSGAGEFDKTKGFGVLANWSVTYFYNVAISPEVITDLEDSLSSVSGFAVTVPGDRITLDNLNDVLETDSSYFHVVSAPAVDGAFTFDGADTLATGDILNGTTADLVFDDTVSDDTIFDFVLVDDQGVVHNINWDAPVSRLVVEERAAAPVSDDVADLDDRVYALETEDPIVGPAGATGVAGIDGEDGLDGQDGIDGEDGANGYDGIDGEDGIAGVAGAQGIAGVAGAQGATGAVGTTGEAGVQGPRGTVGVAGVAGMAGAQGPQGITGVAGIDGLDGDHGIDGDAGVAGIDGEDGLDGLDGEDGMPGIHGEDGLDGEDGIDGTRGPRGMSGIDGVAGVAGDDFDGDDRLADIEDDYITSADLDDAIATSIVDGLTADEIAVITNAIDDTVVTHDELAAVLADRDARIADLEAKLECVISKLAGKAMFTGIEVLDFDTCGQ